jgi:hypothetical protein
MGVLDDTQFVERPQFFNGQRLLAPDLQSVEAFNREMRWLHNKSLHQPGIGSGFAVSGDKGDRVVTVGPGYALEKEGREIFLTRELQLPIPPVAGEEDGTPSYFDLTVSYADELEEAETRAGVCLPRGVVRRREEPVFCWVPIHCEAEPLNQQKKMQCRADEANRMAILSGEKIVLARVAVKDCALYERVTLNHRRSARSCRQPHVFGANTKLKDLKEIPLANLLTLLSQSSSLLTSFITLNQVRAAIEKKAKQTPFLFVQGAVDASGGQFLTVPSYLITLQRNNLQEGTGVNLPVLAVWTRNESEQGFEVILAIYVGNPGRESDKDKVKKDGDIPDEITESWSISWMGVEG